MFEVTVLQFFVKFNYETCNRPIYNCVPYVGPGEPLVLFSERIAQFNSMRMQKCTIGGCGKVRSHIVL